MDSTVRPYSQVYDTLRKVGLRPTRQRLGLARLLFANGDRHVTAEQLHAEAASVNLRVSLDHFFHEDTAQLQDIPGDAISVGKVPEPPAGTRVERVDIIVRIRG
jgi:Fur family iron response transcriptional regulator